MPRDDVWGSMLDARGHLEPIGRHPRGSGLERAGRFGRGLALAAKSWEVIRGDRSLLVLPLLQLLCQAAAVAVVAGAGYAAHVHVSRLVLLAGVAVTSLPLNFVATFFGVAFVAVVRAHLDGERLSLRDALAFARSRLPAVTGWALLNTFVGVAISALEQVRGGALAARIAGWVLNVAWALAVFFILPALASERIGPVAAARRSASVVKRKWPEGIVGTTVIAAAFGVLTVPLVLVGVAGWFAYASAPGLGVLLLAVGVGGFLILGSAQAAVEGVFRFVLYDYATTETVRAPFTRADLDSGVRPKRRWRDR
jgi:hypothetical protein